MNAFSILAVCVLAATAISATTPIREANRVSGENGWYMPQTDGTFVWLDKQTGENTLAGLRLNERLRPVFTPVNYYLYTRTNPTDGQNITDSAMPISASNFNPKNPTRIVVHGWLEGYTANNYINIRDAFLSVGDHNIIIVDWARARGDYNNAVVATSTVGQKIGNFIDNLVANHGLSLNNLYIVGHSLGAQIAGFTSQNVKTGQIHTIVGLDPALPLFDYNKLNERLNSRNAFYVETIHTNGGKFGFLKPIGKASFYPNGGESQPDCPAERNDYCSHVHSVTYYVEAVRLNDFGSIQCSTFQNAVANTCGSTFSSIRMGAANNANTAAGIYYVPVNSTAPFGITN